ncbi:CPBP family glutamic-type intramembrane protease [Dokdonella soli]|uniref:CAAX prenyl protease 2/Lysostaphin resistance protein A-like domain-containing protein n=1 Tax=Dokdonella soli TaxID=529810 RepID=A0ABN1IBH9_9GAMM
MNRFPPQLRIALLLGAAAVLATAALFPYLLALKPGALTLAAAAYGLPPAAVIALQSLQSGVIYFLLAWAGLKLGAPLGLEAGWLGAWLYGRPRPHASNWLLAALLGALCAGAILGAIALFGTPLDRPAVAARDPAPWRGLLASPYGAIVEETGLRVFAMGCIAWLLARITAGVPRTWTMLAAIVLAALLFGVGHLPLAAQLGPLTVAVIARVVSYKAFAGLVFGALYWKRGLEHAMLAHFCADLGLHVVAPAIT